MLEYARTDSPVAGDAWIAKSADERLQSVARTLENNEKFSSLNPTEAREDGQVFVALMVPLAAGERGVLLRSAEAHLKDALDQGITLWCEPLGDKNSLRNLRGIQVRS